MLHDEKELTREQLIDLIAHQEAELIELRAAKLENITLWDQVQNLRRQLAERIMA